MEDNPIEHKKKNGIYYTPKSLADYLVRPMLNKGYNSFFDPAYGDGALLLAAERNQRKNNESVDISLFGCDIHPVNGLLTHLPEANLIESNFFEFDSCNKFDAVLTNPPYIRHQEQDKTKIKAFKKSIEELQELSNSSDLWAYFLIKAEQHLKKGGGLGAIVPWALLQADYAQNFRKHLLEKYEKIKVLALNTPYFEDAQERIVLLWLSNYGAKNKEIIVGFSKGIENEIEYRKLNWEDWAARKVITAETKSLKKIQNTLNRKYGFRKFSEYADVRIGVVTGANDFFIKDYSTAKSLGFKKNDLKPIITSAKDFPNFMKNGGKNLKRLLLINDPTAQRIQDYLKEGIESQLDQRSHCQKRKPWYYVRDGKIPDAFFPYRVETIPYLVLNYSKVQSTNSVHRIYFKKVSDTQKKWIHVSMLSLYGQLSLEAESKTYGRGMLKIEPGSLYNCQVLSKSDESIDGIYQDLIKNLEKGDKANAVNLATAFINQHLDIDDDLYFEAFKIYNRLQSSKLR